MKKIILILLAILILNFNLAAAADVKFTLKIYPGMPHDFALMLPNLQDSLDSFKEIQDFINLHMND